MAERAQAELTKFQNTYIFRRLCNDRFYSHRIKANSRSYCAVSRNVIALGVQLKAIRDT